MEYVFTFAPLLQVAEVNQSTRKDARSLKFCPVSGRQSAQNSPCIVIHARCIFIRGRIRFADRPFALRSRGDFAVKDQRLNAIRDLLSSSLVASQDELRRKLRRRGFRVTQATLSRDIHELRLFKGPGGYSLPNGHTAAPAAEEADEPPLVEEMLESFGLRVRQAMNQVVVSTVLGGAQPVAAALDRVGWPEVLGTIAGDDTVLVICPDARRAGEVEGKIRSLLES
jgi:transcriptional regulator of arginine metabolism